MWCASQPSPSRLGAPRPGRRQPRPPIRAERRAGAVRDAVHDPVVRRRAAGRSRGASADRLATSPPLPRPRRARGRRDPGRRRCRRVRTDRVRPREPARRTRASRPSSGWMRSSCGWRWRCASSGWCAAISRRGAGRSNWPLVRRDPTSRKHCWRRHGPGRRLRLPPRRHCLGATLVGGRRAGIPGPRRRERHWALSGRAGHRRLRRRRPRRGPETVHRCRRAVPPIGQPDPAGHRALQPDGGHPGRG